MSDTVNFTVILKTIMSEMPLVLAFEVKDTTWFYHSPKPMFFF